MDQEGSEVVERMSQPPQRRSGLLSRFGLSMAAWTKCYKIFQLVGQTVSCVNPREISILAERSDVMDMEPLPRLGFAAAGPAFVSIS